MAARAAWRHPQWWLVAIIAAGWAVMLAGSSPDEFGALCVALGVPGGNRAVGIIAHWLAMIAAMMLPLALPMARHVASRSLWRNRHRAMGWFVLGYLAPWLLSGLAGAMLAWLLGASSLVPFIALVLAAIWHWTPMRRAALRRCHRVLPVAAGGPEGRRSCLAFGLFHGRACVATCGPLMLALALAGHALPAMLLVALVSATERFWPRLPGVAVGCVPLALVALRLT